MSLRHAVLGLLAKRPASGYDLLSTFNRSLGYVWPAQQSQLYGELGRLAEAGLVQASEPGVRGRKEYSLTPSGLAELRTWLTETRPDSTSRNEPLLRVFFLWTLLPEERVAYLRSYAEEALSFLETMRLIRDTTDWDDSGFDRCARLALEHGLRVAATTSEWAGWAVDQAADLDRANQLST